MIQGPILLVSVFLARYIYACSEHNKYTYFLFTCAVVHSCMRSILRVLKAKKNHE